MFERWLHTRLIQAPEAKYGTDMKMVLVMDNASYHHELNHEYFPKGKTPSNAPEGLCNVVLYKAGCRSITPSRSTGRNSTLRSRRAPRNRTSKSDIPGAVYSTRQFPPRSFCGRAPPRHERVPSCPLPPSA